MDQNSKLQCKIRDWTGALHRRWARLSFRPLGGTVDRSECLGTGQNHTDFISKQRTINASCSKPSGERDPAKGKDKVRD
ncbi:hypothetical protein L2E82_10606 [Cichorium intybus]|uniref:Uncharacterized protein n=1 Tax=Cichorium intybus TaxID=13427 RepID=A0ACB9GBN4_CICIN|nr:hypothetical protein L2E82_10606 [Cichorium intybus]